MPNNYIRSILNLVNFSTKEILNIGNKESEIIKHFPAAEIAEYPCEDKKKFDLIILDEALTDEKTAGGFLDAVMKHAMGLVVTRNNKEKEINDLPFMISECEYNGNRLALYDFSPTQRFASYKKYIDLYFKKIMSIEYDNNPNQA